MRKEKTRSELEQFHRAQQDLKARQKIEMEEENQKIMAYCLEQERKRLEEESLKQKVVKDRAELNDKMVSKLSHIIVSFSIY